MFASKENSSSLFPKYVFEVENKLFFRWICDFFIMIFICWKARGVVASQVHDMKYRCRDDNDIASTFATTNTNCSNSSGDREHCHNKRNKNQLK